MKPHKCEFFRFDNMSGFSMRVCAWDPTNLHNVIHRPSPGDVVFKVEAGIVSIGDPCYILRDDRSKHPRHELLEHTFEKLVALAREADPVRTDAMLQADANIRKKDNLVNSPGFNYMDMTKEMHKGAERPATSFGHGLSPEGFQGAWGPYFKEGGKPDPGLGIVVSAGYGDGSYPVYAEYVKDSDEWDQGRIARVTITFIDPAEDSEDEGVALVDEITDMAEKLEAEGEPRTGLMTMDIDPDEVAQFLRGEADMRRFIEENRG